jgi:2-polyprenyl-3-methyl-5-hydroxy-6-metoxy-1,4-benzoquinol methylase
MRDFLQIVEEAKTSVVCHVCGSIRWKILLHGYDRNLSTTNEQFSVIQCRECGLGQTVPQINSEEFEKFYPEHFYQIKSLPKNYIRKIFYWQAEARLRRHEQAKVKGIKKFKVDGRILDIGCGMGNFLVEASLAGYDTQGIEYSEIAAEYARKVFNINVVTGDFLNFNFAKEQFDIITLWHVLEHFHDPISVLKKASALLRANGIIVISLPNLTSFQARLFGHRWLHLDLPRHLYHYSPRSLSMLVEKFGFSVLWTNHNCLEYNRNGYLGSVIRLQDPNEKVLTKIFRKSIGYYLSGIPARVEALLKSGGTFELYALKK